MQSCSPIASASAAARRLRASLQLLLLGARARLRHPLQLLLPVCLRFQLLLPGPIAASASTAAPRLPPLPAAAPRDCARFSCCSPLASASAAAPDRVRFGCYSPIASASTVAPRLRLLDSILRIRTFFAEFEVHEGRASSPAPRTSHFRYRHTLTHTVKILMYGY